jgi:hypothetical protein
VLVPYANLTNPQTLNFYAMVSDDPESFADLDGHTNQQCSDVMFWCTLPPILANQNTVTERREALLRSVEELRRN